MALTRREALILGGVAAAAAAAGFFAGPKLLVRGTDADALKGVAFEDLAGKLRQLSEWQGKLLVLNFWATWCAPCREEIPMLIAARERYAPNGVEIVGIAIDLAAKVAQFARSMKITYPVLVADSGGLDLMRRLGNGAGGLPYTVFVGRQGKPVDRKLGALNEAEFDRMLSRALRG